DEKSPPGRGDLRAGLPHREGPTAPSLGRPPFRPSSQPGEREAALFATGTSSQAEARRCTEEGDGPLPRTGAGRISSADVPSPPRILQKRLSTRRPLQQTGCNPFRINASEAPMPC